MKTKTMTAATIILLITTVATGLIAGLYYAYSCSVNDGLGRLPDAEYLAAVQSINRAILNPVFFFSFMGTLFLLPISTWVSFRTHDGAFIWLLLATVVYVVASFGVTMVGNVPLNDAIEAFNIKTATTADMQAMRARFQPSWNRLHSIRTIASVLSFLLTVIACLVNSGRIGK